MHKREWGVGFGVMLAFLLAASGLEARQGGNDDGSGEARGTDRFFTELKAPLQAVDCAATPPTITVLGLTIDISNAEVRNEISGMTGCGSLTVGQTVEIEFGSDQAPLKALEVKVDPDKQGKLEIQGPLQMVDPSGQTVQVLGLVIDASGAELDNFTSLDDLELSQIVEVDLEPSELPALVAESLLKKSGSFIKTCKLTSVFSAPNRDAMNVSGSLQLSNSFTAAGKTVVLNVGGQSFNFILDAAGKGTAAEGRFSLTGRPGRFDFKGTFSRGNFHSQWSDEGIVDGAFKNQPILMSISLTIDGVSYGGDVNLLYTARAGIKGLAK